MRQVTARSQFWFNSGSSIGSTSFGDTVVLPGDSNPTKMPLSGGARFLPYGQSIDRHEYELISNHDILLGANILNPLKKGSIFTVTSDVLNDPISHLNLNNHLNDDNSAFKVDPCNGAQDKLTIQDEIIRILENPSGACAGSS